ncbi:MAG: HNH endonuclease [Actinobacteria bacterium]|nr:HNH endonuclease [Actinomycetota bacterium]
MFDPLIASADSAHERIGRAHLDLLRLIVDIDRREAWRDSGARDTAHWLSMRYGLSSWKAYRWIAASHELEGLPAICDALARGEIGIDKVVELTRFATPDTEARLLAWAGEVSSASVRRRADIEVRTSRAELLEAERDRSVAWWYYDDGRRFGLQADLPAADGAVVARALERVARSIPVMPGEEDADFAEARRADALVALCAARISDDPDPDRATVVIHAPLESLNEGTGGCEVEDGPPVHPETVRRLLCTSRLQAVLEDRSGTAVRFGRMTREPSPAMLRQVRYRDHGCRFPGCGVRRFTEAHHIVWWRNGGRTDLDNLVLICSFHHRLVHEHGWRVERDPSGEIRWLRPDGVRYRAGPSPGATSEREALLAATG